MVLYIVGPSGVGKSECCKHAATVLEVQHRDLDVLCCRRWAGEWRVCREIIESVQRQALNSHLATLLDVGAGTQVVPEFKEYAAKTGPLLLVYAPPEEVFPRNPLGIGRGLEEFTGTEYTKRRELYSSAIQRLDVSGLTREQASATFVTLLRSKYGLRDRVHS